MPDADSENASAKGRDDSGDEGSSAKKKKSSSRDRSKRKKSSRSDSNSSGSSKQKKSKKNKKGSKGKSRSKGRKRSRSKDRKRSKSRDRRKRSRSKDRKRSRSKKKSRSRRRRSASRRKQRSASRQHRRRTRSRSANANKGSEAFQREQKALSDSTYNPRPTFIAKDDGNSSKWDQKGPDGNGKAPEVPDWLSDIMPRGAPAGGNSSNFRVFAMASVHIRALIGKGGETIREVRAKATGDIKIEHQHTDPQGILTITGDVEKSIQLIKDCLESKGCPWSGPDPLGTGPLSVGNSKTFQMEAVHIRALIGKGGETIREVRAKSTADIKIEHKQDLPQGTVTITGDVERAEAIIRETLQSKGHVWTGPGEDVIPVMPGVTPPPGAALIQIPAIPAEEIEDIFVPPEFMSHIMGPGCATLKDVRQKSGNLVFISILPSPGPGAPQTLRLVGSGRDVARQMVEQMMEQIKRGTFIPPPTGGMLALGPPPPPPPPMVTASSTVAAGETGTQVAHTPQVVLPPQRPQGPVVGFLTKNVSKEIPGAAQWAGTQPAYSTVAESAPVQVSPPAVPFENGSYGGNGFTQPSWGMNVPPPPQTSSGEFPQFQGTNNAWNGANMQQNIEHSDL